MAHTAQSHLVRLAEASETTYGRYSHIAPRHLPDECIDRSARCSESERDSDRGDRRVTDHERG